jgi:hypothetical protein
MEMVLQCCPVQDRYIDMLRVFLIEGLFTVLLAIASFFLIVPLPEHSTFLKPEEKTLLLKRLAEDDASNTNEQKTPLTITDIFKTMTHWKIVLPCAFTPLCLQSNLLTQPSLLACFACNVAASALTAFQPTVLKNLGYTSSQAQIHTIPVYMVAMFFCLLAGYLSDITHIRFPYVLLGGIVTLVGWALELCAVKHIDISTGLGWPHERYAGMFLILIGFSMQLPILIGWVGNILKGRKERIVGFATLIGGSQLGNLVSANVFFARQEKCGYRTGMATGVGVSVMGIVAVCLFFAGLWWENKRLERRERDVGEGGVELREIRNVL